MDRKRDAQQQTRRIPLSLKPHPPGSPQGTSKNTCPKAEICILASRMIAVKLLCVQQMGQIGSHPTEGFPAVSFQYRPSNSKSPSCQHGINNSISAEFPSCQCPCCHIQLHIPCFQHSQYPKQNAQAPHTESKQAVLEPPCAIKYQIQKDSCQHSRHGELIIYFMPD